MDFCTISPIEGLERYGTSLSNRHLVLAQLLHNDRYLQYYETRRRTGGILILDNGAYENTKPLDSDAYVNWILNLNPQIVVLPDQLMSNWRKTTSLSLNFLDRIYHTPRFKSFRTSWMFVPQTEPSNKVGVFKALEHVLDDGRVGHMVNWIGLGRYLATEIPAERTTNVPLGWTFRCEVAEWVRKNFKHVQLHALGMNAGDIGELTWLRAIGVVSIDSSCAVWRGWNGYSLDFENAGELWKANGSPCDFFATDSQSHTTIEHNLEVIRNAING